MTGGQRIPRVFHFVFGLKPQTEPFHLLHYLCLRSCQQVNAPERILFHFHHEPHGRYWELARRLVTPQRVSPDRLVGAFCYPDPGVAQYSYAHHADFIRLEQLAAHGGVYADIDTLFVHPIPASLFDEPCVLGREDEIIDQGTGKRERSLCNALIMAEPGAAFIRLWLEQSRRAFDGSWSRHSTLLPQRLSEERPELIHVEPQRTFYPFMWTPADLAALFEGRRDLDQGVASIHLWSHLWWSKRRRDFSRVHQGIFTERYIHANDTTFNLLARPHLPRQNEQPGLLRRILGRR